MQKHAHKCQPIQSQLYNQFNSQPQSYTDTQIVAASHFSNILEWHMHYLYDVLTSQYSLPMWQSDSLMTETDMTRVLPVWHSDKTHSSPDCACKTPEMKRKKTSADLKRRRKKENQKPQRFSFTQINQSNPNIKSTTYQTDLQNLTNCSLKWSKIHPPDIRQQQSVTINWF